MNQVEEKLLFPSSYVVSGFCSQAPNGEKKPRRRRRKARSGDGSGSDEAKKRRLNDDQVKFLEMSFRKERKLETGRKVHLASELGLEPKQVAVWFQNRRARHKSKQLEEEYMKLKSAHDAVIVQKCHLENEVLMLKEKVSRVEEEMSKLSVTANGANAGGNSSPTSSFSTVTCQPLVREFVAEGEVDLTYINEYSYNYMLDYVNFYGM